MVLDLGNYLAKFLSWNVQGRKRLRLSNSTLFIVVFILFKNNDCKDMAVLLCNEFLFSIGF